MKRISLTETSHNIVRERLQTGDTAIDATLGNGHDCLFLTECVGGAGHVYGFDIQTQAIEASQHLLRQHQLESRATLIQASHADMCQFIPSSFHGQIAAIMFNLGYLPGTDKTIMTQTQTTLQAIQAACGLLATHGVMTVLAYPGHAGGDQETHALQAWLEQLDDGLFSVETFFSQHHQEHAPRLFVLRKRA